MSLMLLGIKRSARTLRIKGDEKSKKWNSALSLLEWETHVSECRGGEVLI